VERIGIFGGTFDPIHIAHVFAAVSARYQCELDRVLFVVAGDPWQKHGTVVASAEDRYAMVAAALDGADGLEPSRIEIDRPGPSYMVDTAEALTAPDRELFLVIGADAASRLSTWQRADDLRALVTLAVVGRAESAPQLDGWPAVAVDMPRLDVSSTELRARIGAGAPIDVLVPEPVVRVIRDRGLYTAG
jgi:nicotinate-nucleotide adenylyltransferase